MDNYNKYLINDLYDSQIIFINTKESVVKKTLFWVTFNDDKRDMFLDNSDHLKNYLINNLNNKTNEPLMYENIKSVSHVIKYYSFIKVIKDKQNPQLEGEILMFSYSRAINNIIDEYLETHNEFNNIFNLVKHTDEKLYHGFPSYENSSFEGEHYKFDDDTLVIETDFKTFVLPHIYYREMKINKIKENLNKYKTNIKQIEKIESVIPHQKEVEHLKNNLFKKSKKWLKNIVEKLNNLKCLIKNY